MEIFRVWIFVSLYITGGDFYKVALNCYKVLNKSEMHMSRE